MFRLCGVLLLSNSGSGNKQMNKKSVFYTIAAIALTLVILATHSAYKTYKLNEKMEVIETRVDTVNFFIKDVEKDLEKGANIAGFRTLLSFNQFITGNGTYLSNINDRFKEAFLNGTINNMPQSLMLDSTFSDWATKISGEADKIDISFNFSINDVKLNQSDPWSVDIGLNITLDVKDKKNTSSWSRNRFLSTKVSIIGFEDPVYVLNSNGRVTNSIESSNISSFVVNGDPTNLMIHANNSFYIAHNDAPSFLMRISGDLGNSSQGIESLVNLEKFQQQGLPLKDKSAVDYIYFGAKTTTDFRINKTPEWFKLDQGHLDVYQAINITI